MERKGGWNNFFPLRLLPLVDFFCNTWPPTSGGWNDSSGFLVHPPHHDPWGHFWRPNAPSPPRTALCSLCSGWAPWTTSYAGLVSRHNASPLPSASRPCHSRSLIMRGQLHRRFGVGCMEATPASQRPFPSTAHGGAPSPPLSQSRRCCLIHDLAWALGQSQLRLLARKGGPRWTRPLAATLCWLMKI